MTSTDYGHALFLLLRCHRHPGERGVGLTADQRPACTACLTEEIEKMPARQTRFTLPTGGPVHAQDPGASLPARAECGARRQFRHVKTEKPVDCRACLRGLAG